MFASAEVGAALQKECEICGASARHFWVKKQGYDFVRCDGCGLGFRSPLPTAEELLNIYETFARGYYLKEEKRTIDHSIDHSERIKELRPYKKLGSILDVGCSTGGFLNAVRKAGWAPHGVDLSPTVAGACLENGLQVRAGQLVDMDYPEGYFDVVRFSATLEHVSDPFSCVRQAYRILRKGGLLHFSVPNIDSLMVKLLGSRYRYICDEHLYYYSKKSIDTILSRNGFKEGIKITAQRFDVFPFWEDWRGMVPESNTKTVQKETVFVEEAKRRWYHKPLKVAYQSFLKLLEWTALGENWYVYSEK